MVSFTLAELAQRFDLELKGDGTVAIGGVCTLTPGKPGSIGFLANPKYRAQLAATAAGAVIVGRRDAPALGGNGLVAPDPHLAYARIARLFDRSDDFSPGVDASASVAAGVQIGAGAHVGPCSVLEEGVQIGAGVFIGPNCVLGRGARIGAHTRLEAQVFIGARVRVGERCRFNPGAIVGARGFGLAMGPKGWEEVPQLGSVVIGNDVEVGANTCIDRGALEDTVIDDGVKLDNLIQVAHNVRIGAQTAMAGSSGVAGSATIGRRCMIGGAAVINGHIRIADDVVILGRGMVTASVTEKGVYGSGLPLSDAREWRRTVARIRRLGRIEERLKQLEKKLDIAGRDEDGESDD